MNKREAVIYMIEKSHKPITWVASKAGLTTNTIHKWKRDKNAGVRTLNVEAIAKVTGFLLQWSEKEPDKVQVNNNIPESVSDKSAPYSMESTIKILLEEVKTLSAKLALEKSLNRVVNKRNTDEVIPFDLSQFAIDLNSASINMDSIFNSEDFAMAYVKDQVIMKVNKSFVEAYGYKRIELEGKSFDECDLFEDGNLNLIKNRWDQNRTRDRYHVEITHRKGYKIPSTLTVFRGELHGSQVAFSIVEPCVDEWRTWAGVYGIEHNEQTIKDGKEPWETIKTMNPSILFNQYGYTVQDKPSIVDMIHPDEVLAAMERRELNLRYMEENNLSVLILNRDHKLKNKNGIYISSICRVKTIRSNSDLRSEVYFKPKR